MKTTEFLYGANKRLHLYLNGNAMFDIQQLDADAPEGQTPALDLALQNTADGKAALCKIAHILAEQGELCRRHLHYAPERIPPADELDVILSPMQILALRTAVVSAVNAGYSQPTDDDDGDIDLGLAELEKKTKP